jgi:hypothetical protein
MIRIILKLHKRDTAFVYAILESLEGMVSFSTLPFEKGSLVRELELFVAKDFISDVEYVLQSFKKKMDLEIIRF